MIHINQTTDKELLEEILKQLKENNYICPCSVRKDPILDRCMCESFREQIERKEAGECHCGRYILTITND